MTHPDTAKLINDQIALELRKLNSITTFDSEKPAILQRIADLKAMLDDSSEPVKETATPDLKTIAINTIRTWRSKH